MMVQDFIKRHRLFRRTLCVSTLSFVLCSTGIVSGCSTWQENDFTSQARRLVEQGKYSDLIALSEKELKAKPSAPELFAYRGVAQLRSGKGELAKADLMKAISLDDKVGWYHRELGNVYSDQGQYRDAIASFDKSLRLDSSGHNASGVFAGRAYANLCLSELGKAVADADEAIKLDPKQSYNYCTRAEAYSALGEFDKGFLDANKAIELDSKFPGSYLARATLYLGKGDCERSYTDALTVLSLNNKYWRATEYLIAIKLIKGDTVGALKAADQLIAQFPDAAVGYADKASCYFCMGDLGQAAKLADRALALQPDSHRALQLRAFVAARLDDEKKAFDLLDKAEKLELGGSIVAKDRIISLLFLKKYQEALGLCDATIANELADGKQYKSDTTYRLRSEVYRRLKLNELADGDMKKALAQGYQKRSVLEQYLKLL
ncbi:MAG: tetratricopeptide repeat protein [Candidatus Melainabacteria bacterium]|nr:tetratricopeptide repeat protein [Candidatus Melainabacteria bacterium]